MLDFKKRYATFSIKLQKCCDYQNEVEFYHKSNGTGVFGWVVGGFVILMKTQSSTLDFVIFGSFFAEDRSFNFIFLN